MAADRTYTVADVRRRYGVSSDTVRTWIQSGELAAVNVARPGSKRPRWRFTESAVAAFEASRTATPAPKTQPRARHRRSGDVIEFYT